jgi:endonuclease YncB( thermonuclease family)
VNKEMIATGFAKEYTYKKPYKYQKEFREAEIKAKNEKL